MPSDPEPQQPLSDVDRILKRAEALGFPPERVRTALGTPAPGRDASGARRRRRRGLSVPAFAERLLRPLYARAGAAPRRGVRPSGSSTSQDTSPSASDSRIASE